MKNRWKSYIVVIVVLVVGLAAIVLLFPQKPKEIGSTTTIGERIDFSADVLMSYGVGCKDAAGKEYSRISEESGEINEIKAILSNVEITPIDQTKSLSGYYLIIEMGNSIGEMGNSGVVVFHTDDRVEIGSTVYRSKQPIEEILQKLADIYKREKIS